MFSEELNHDQSTVASCYGATTVLKELGEEVIKTSLIPNVKSISEK
jgi:hypothetical protein